MRSPADRSAPYVLPYVATVIATWALLSLASRTQWIELVVAALLQLFVGALLWLWHPGHPSSLRFMTAAGALVLSVALIRDASGSNPGVSALVLLPVVVAALRASPRELIFALAAAAAALYVPELVIGGDHYPTTALRGATITVLVGAAIGTTVLSLVREMADGQERQRRLREEAQEQLVTQDALRRVATLVAAGAPATEVFAEVSEELARIAGASMGAVVRFDSELDNGELVGRWRADGRVTVPRRVDLHGMTASAQVARTGQPVSLLRYESDDGPGEGVASVAAPIFVDGRLWGAASAIFKADEVIPPGLQARFEWFAELVAMAIANAEVVSELVEHASIDALTGIPNRRSFDEQLASELERAARHHRPLSVVMFDIDHFKQVNDSHGHQAGDRVLAATAELLSSHVRNGEMIARVGGEEFVWLMPETTIDEAVVAADRARRAVGETEFPGVGHITLSAGVQSNAASDRRADLLGGADRALYEAKARGRNQTVAASAASASASAADARVKPAAA